MEYLTNRCPKLLFTAEIVENINAGANFRKCELIDKQKVTHDTHLYKFNLPISTRMSTPVGYHVFLRLIDDNSVIKPYTVVNETVRTPNVFELNGKQVCLLIKSYETGYLTSKLNQLKLGAFVEISNFAGTFQVDKLNNLNELYLICAGTGLTPMLRVLGHSLKSLSIS